MFRNEIHEDKACINSRMLLNAAELVSVEESKFRRIMLKSIGQNLSQEFTERVEESNGAVGLGIE